MRNLRIQLRGQAFLITNHVVSELPDAEWVRVAFVRRLLGAQRLFKFTLFGFKLTRTSYELVVRSDEDNGLADVLQFLQSSFARDVNRALSRRGALFRRRYQDKALIGEHVLEEMIARTICDEALLSSLPITRGGRLSDLYPYLDREPTISLPPRFATAQDDMVADASARWFARIAEIDGESTTLLSAAKCIAASWSDVFTFEAWRCSVERDYRKPAHLYCRGQVSVPFPRGTHPPSRAPEPIASKVHRSPSPAPVTVAGPHRTPRARTRAERGLRLITARR